jgi:hypothetical protein
MLVPHPPYADESASVRQEGGALGVVTDLGGRVATGAMCRRVGAWNSAITYVLGPLRPGPVPLLMSTRGVNKPAGSDADERNLAR